MKMDCRTATHCVEDFLDGLLDDATRGGFQAHVESCPDCRKRLEDEQDLRDALRSLPVPELDPDFAERAFRKAAAAPTYRSRIDVSAFMKVAASILVIIAFGFMFRGAWGPGQPEWPEAYVRLNQPEEVKLVFYSEENLENVTLSLSPPEGIELVGFENQREIVWQTDLKQGENLLVLPVIAHKRQGGSLVAKIRHGNLDKQFHLQLRVQQPEVREPGADRFEGRVASTRFI